MTDTWTPPDAPRARAEREYTALFRIHQRHANDPARRNRGRHLPVIGPGEAVRLVVGLAAGGLVVEDGEDAVDTADLTAALTLMPMVRAEIDQLESSLLMTARGQGMTWQEMAFWLGLGSAQAARQRYERLTRRTAPGHAPAGRSTGTDDLLWRRIDASLGERAQPGWDYNDPAHRWARAHRHRFEALRHSSWRRPLPPPERFKEPSTPRPWPCIQTV